MNSVCSVKNVVRELKRSLHLALPLMASELIYALNGFVATIMVAHLGKAELAANALVWSTFIAEILFFIGILSAVGILVAQSYGSKDNHGISLSFKQGIILAILFIFPMMLIMWVSPVILKLTGQRPEVILLAKPFFYSLTWCMLPLNFIIVMEQLLIGISKTRMVLFMSILQVPLQIFFYYVFLFGKFGMPKLGLVGIGYSMSVAFWIVAAYFGCYLCFSKYLKPYRLFEKWWLINKKFLFELLRVGMPLGGMYCVEVALFAAIAFMMGRLGTTALAAHQIVYQCFIFALTLLFAMSQSTTVRVGHEVGRNNKETLKLAAFTNMGISIFCMLIFGILYIGFPNVVIGMDVNIHAQSNQLLVQDAKTFLILASILLLSDSFRLVAVGALRGLKDTKASMYISMIAFWLIAFPSAYLLAFHLHLGGAGIWLGLVIGLASCAMILIVRFNKLVDKIDLASLVTR